MQHYTLTKYTDNSILFSGYYPSFVHCLEDAVEKQVDLSYVDLKSHNLTNANLDGAHMPSAQMNGANLTGANLSEANLTQAVFHNTTLYSTCLSYSDLRNSDFRSASFGATMIEGCNIRNCVFSTLSCFDLEFTLTDGMSGCLFAMPDGGLHHMSKHPIVLKGVLNTPIVILDQAIKIGEKIFPKNTIPTIINLIERHSRPALENNFQNIMNEKK